MRSRDALLLLRDAINKHVPATVNQAESTERLSDEGVTAIYNAAVELQRIAKRLSQHEHSPSDRADEWQELADPRLRCDVLRCLARALRKKASERVWHSHISNILFAVLTVGSLSLATNEKGQCWEILHTTDNLVAGFTFSLPGLGFPGFDEVAADVLAAVTGCFKESRTCVLRWRAACVAASPSADAQQHLHAWIRAQSDCGYALAVLEHWLHTAQVPAGDKRAAYERTRFMAWAFPDALCNSMSIHMDRNYAKQNNNHAWGIAFVLHMLKGGETVAQHALLKGCMEALRSGSHHAEALAQCQANDPGLAPQAYDANLLPTLCLLGELCCVALAAQPPPPPALVAQALPLFERFSGRLPKRLYAEYAARRKAERSVEAAVKRLKELIAAQQPTAPVTPPTQAQPKQQARAQAQARSSKANAVDMRAQRAQAQGDADAVMRALLAEEEDRAARAAAKDAKRKARQQAAQPVSVSQRPAPESASEREVSDAESEALSGPEQLEPSEAASDSDGASASDGNSDSAGEQGSAAEAEAVPSSPLAHCSSPTEPEAARLAERPSPPAAVSEPPGGPAGAGASGQQRPHAASGSTATAASGVRAGTLSAAAAPYLPPARREPPPPDTEPLALPAPSAAPRVRPRPPPGWRRQQQATPAPSMQSVSSQEDRSLDVFTCPITQELLRDPVLDADGFTYERDAIEEWIRRKGVSPMTDAPLALTDLRPNRIVRQWLEERLA